MFKGSIPALVTPMRADGSIDFDAWDRLLEFHAAAGTDAVVVGGTTGESPVLERAELGELVRRAAKRLSGRMRPERRPRQSAPYVSVTMPACRQ